MEGVLQVLERIGNVLDRQAQGQGNVATQAAETVVAAVVNENQTNMGQTQPTGVRQMPQLVEQFMKLKPPNFHGRGDPEAAPRWVKELEKTFKVLGCTDEEKVTLTVYQLQEGANDW